MLIETRSHGHISVSRDEIIYFVKPLISLEDFRYFVIYESARYKNMYWLQSVEWKDLTFLIADPRRFYPDYELTFDYAAENLTALKCGQFDRLLTYSILRSDGETFFINLLGPVLINPLHNLAAQVISSNDYNPAYPATLSSQPTQQHLREHH